MSSKSDYDDDSFGDALMKLRIVRDPAVEPLFREIWTVPNKLREYSLLVVEIDGTSCAEHIYRGVDLSERMTTGTCQNFCVRDVHSVARTGQVIISVG